MIIIKMNIILIYFNPDPNKRVDLIHIWQGMAWNGIPLYAAKTKDSENERMMMK